MATGPGTTWAPDTCDCVVEYFNDDGSFKDTLAACIKHVALGDTPEHLATLLQHNRLRNAVRNEIVELLGLAADDQAPELTIVYDRTALGPDPVLVDGLKALLARLGFPPALVPLLFGLFKAYLEAKFPGNIQVNG